MLTESLDIRDEVLRVVAREISVKRTCMRRAAPAIALIEQHDPISARIEQPAMPHRAPRTRPSVQHDRGVAARISASLPVHAIAVTNLEHPVRVRFDRWI